MGCGRARPASLAAGVGWVGSLPQGGGMTIPTHASTRCCARPSRWDSGVLIFPGLLEVPQAHGQPSILIAPPGALPSSSGLLESLGERTVRTGQLPHQPSWPLDLAPCPRGQEQALGTLGGQAGPCPSPASGAADEVLRLTDWKHSCRSFFGHESSIPATNCLA